MKKTLCVLLLLLSGCAFDGTYYYDDGCDRGYYEYGVYYPHHYRYYSTYPHHTQWGVRCHRCHLPMYRCHCH